MNRQHLRTILWLRWRLLVNQIRKGGVVNATLLAILVAVLLLGSMGAFFLSLFLGVVLFPAATPDTLLYVWDAIVIGFLMFWLMGLFAELQRSETLSLARLLHLPILLGAAFFTNYLGSLFSVTLALFLPAMLGSAIALVWTKGIAMLLLFPLVAGFVFMVTALTYQFQGWLAALMTSPRKRRTVLVLATLVFVLIFQLPSLLNSALWRSPNRNDRERIRGQADRVVSVIRPLNLALPIGWLPYGARSCAAGNPVPALLGTLGMGLIGAASLRRSYLTALRLYQGQFSATAPQPQPAPVAAKPMPPAKPGPGRPSLLERSIPFASEHASAITLASFRSLVRAPEAKILLLGPVVLVMLFGSLLFGRGFRLGVGLRPLAGLGVAAFLMLTTLQLMTNQFGLDRGGFRAFVLSPVRRNDILLGKNLSVAPLALGLGSLAIAILQVMAPMRVDHLFATLAATISLFLLICMIGNLASIFTPFAFATASLKPANPRAATVLIQLLFTCLIPVLCGIVLIPFGLELLLAHFGVYLAFAWLELGLVVLLYRKVLDWQGALLQRREQQILEVLSATV